jgi:hypothetical protein
MAPQPTTVFHITRRENLPSILAAGGLWARNRHPQAGVACRGIAFPSIQDRRARTVVPCGPGGTLHDYVPFFFTPRSPMLYTIHRGNVPDCPDGQRPIIQLATTAQALYTAGRHCVFTDGHAIMALSNFFTDPADLGRVDGTVMRSALWANTADDADRMRRRQAEFLVRDFVPWESIAEIGVIDLPTKRHVAGLLGGAAHRPAVSVRRGWYYA